MVVPLKVSGAFHSRMMKEPAGEFASFLEDFSFKTSIARLNVQASAYTNAEQIKSLLVEQMYSSVLCPNRFKT